MIQRGYKFDLDNPRYKSDTISNTNKQRGNNMKFAKRSTATEHKIIDLTNLDADTLIINGDKFAGTKEVKGKRGPFTTYLFESDEGEVTSVAATGHLKFKIEREAELQLGEKVQLTYLGKADVNGRGVHQFDLLVAEPEEM